MNQMSDLAGVIATPAAQADSLEARYRALLRGDCPDTAAWLNGQLRRADALADDLPASPEQLEAWSQEHALQVARQYADYLAERRDGAPRRMFGSRAHALYFLQQVTPTKCVDGAWLQGALHHWDDPRYHGLIRIYLEELGDGQPACNHVVIFRRLLAGLGCHEQLPLADERYLQGALQLALGQESERFLPEVLGYNLGYEQLPLHLLISTFELEELGIDAQYFRLHVTIDNASTGHARKALEALRQLWPEQDGEAFYRRVARGYRLNDLSAGSMDIAAGFDLESELLAALERKRIFGQHLHSDHCRLDGRTVNQWLSAPGSFPAFLQVLQDKGWILRDRDPAESRFWQLIEGPKAVMFGVLSPYEKQLLHDWIAGDWQPQKRRHRPVALAEPLLPALPDGLSVTQLIDAMGKDRHASPRGLAATQRYVQLTGLKGGHSHATDR
ncbi:iron-containing redox enzyme family protein [Pseudomonas sp. Irchel 3E13]|uniref:iron-containing redox enzyme family protein n=1 Tax=Pseudomonas sp. Irchel 3E13 TaxID=2008975 RepID=UPI000BA45972|nr:iron-containing redox enzyme family protein [Pseudomonas sp. Irchel 3E13]